MDPKTLRKSKIEFISEEGKKLKTEYFEELLNQENLTIDEKWFLRGCKHITERHYTEAIKRFQLSSSEDAKLLILLSAFKTGDKFLFDEYYKDNFSDFVYFTKYKFYPYLIIEDKKYIADNNLLKNLIKIEI
ncbi:hypothetical protein [Hydrogenothermus marinus]|uniref:Uncharacterized protein n=1 Tax=Hydrogenothermus marinus TaxID=133270 RepID=A0A3M0BRW4_9AQUI|nr:hypothetical protein [Hydrogenothermus marinus]RMA97578.1 hypothetical protein CLV39_0195 [Hydrogenothermus marinus]